MKPRGMLMIEHRLIERMIALIGPERNRLAAGGDVDSHFVTAAVDFFRNYADRTHHGKEEDILFRNLESREMTIGHRQLMAELIAEHRQSRGIVQTIAAANLSPKAGKTGRRLKIAEQFGALLQLYPQHIEKEDKIFFPAVESYFGPEELGRMLKEFRDFDQAMIHEKYRSVIEELAG